MVAVAARKQLVPHKWQGAKLRALREAKGMSRAALGKEVGATDVAILYWERGDRNPGVNIALDLARFFGVPLVELCPWTDPITPSDGGDD